MNIKHYKKKLAEITVLFRRALKSTVAIHLDQGTTSKSLRTDTSVWGRDKYDQVRIYFRLFAVFSAADVTTC